MQLTWHKANVCKGPSQRPQGQEIYDGPQKRQMSNHIALKQVLQVITILASLHNGCFNS